MRLKANRPGLSAIVANNRIAATQCGRAARAHFGQLGDCAIQSDGADRNCLALSSRRAEQVIVIIGRTLDANKVSRAS